MKGALIGNAAQVLWDTDRRMTGCLRKLVATLKSRYSGERQAEKYRAELQIRRRRSQETLSDLHQDIRRLMVLAYPRLTAEAREEIACDHFTNALSDPDFALKVKERTPKSLDEALNVALRLEAWRKSVKSSRQDDDRSERPKQKARAVTKPDTSKPSNPSGSNDRVARLEAKISRMTEELQKLSEAASDQNSDQWFLQTAILPSKNRRPMHLSRPRKGLNLLSPGATITSDRQCMLYLRFSLSLSCVTVVVYLDTLNATVR